MGLNNALDYGLHFLVVFITILILEYKQKPLSIWLAILINVIYAGQYLSQSRRMQYCAMVEMLSHFTQAICSPGISFCIAAINSYFSLSRLKLSLLAMVLSYHRSTITLLVFKITGSKASWLLMKFLQEGTFVLESHLIFAATAAFIRTICAFRTWTILDNSDTRYLNRQQSSDRASNQQQA